MPGNGHTSPEGRDGGACQLRVEAIGIESRWGPPHLNQPGRSLWLLLGPASWMPENPPEFVGILDDREYFVWNRTFPLNGS
jgi:hypothetical protein